MRAFGRNSQPPTAIGVRHSSCTCQRNIMNDTTRYVDLDEARQQAGLRLVLLSDAPSPWSEAAKDIFTLKQIPFVAVRYRATDDAVRQWTGVHNAPVAVFNDQPALSHWADILALAERLDARYPLIPRDFEARTRMLGLCHEIMSVLGLVWHTRLLVLEVSFRTSGECGFPVSIAKRLSEKYGYGEQPVNASRQRVREILGKLAELLVYNTSAGQGYILGDSPCALDIYCAAALGVMAPLPDAERPLDPRVRHMFESAAEAIRWEIPDILLVHRAFVRQQWRERSLSTHPPALCNSLGDAGCISP